MNSLVLIVEDNITLSKMLTEFLDIHKISFIHASNIDDAIRLFKLNAKEITFVALDGNLDPTVDPENLCTLLLAKTISANFHFEGKVFGISSTPGHNHLFKAILGKKYEQINSSGGEIKVETIKEIVNRILEKREKNSKK